ncbi:MAG: YciI family protein [Rhodospirillaceae bacterium]|nr:YciI family protein [Rhodospirillales bacterium]
MFVVHCQDKPGALQIRLDNRAAHLEFLKANMDKVVMAGPVQTDDRTGMVGSVLVMDFAERAELDAFLANDPYAKAGLFAAVTVLPYKKVLP